MHPIPYANVPPPSVYDIDASHLRTLSICHYVCGGLEMFFGAFGGIYIVLGILMLKGSKIFITPGPTPGGPPPDFMGWVMIGMGSLVVCFGWVVGILTIISGRHMAARHGRVFSLVMAGVSCLWTPFGTALGVFTFIVLLRPTVIAVYSAEKARGASRS